jgi:periplasmic divalent cation tolerance protein
LKAFLVLVTTPGRSTSEKLSKGLLGAKLAACVNSLPGLKSRYWWKGKIETAREELLLIKTNQAKLSPLIRWVKKNHPYTVCEVIALPIAKGNPAYLQWVTQVLSSKF